MPTGTRRVKTPTHAWCCGCEQMVPHEGFQKGQSRCRSCKNATARDRYSKGRTCERCHTARISDYAPRAICRKCSFALRSENAAPRRDVHVRGYVIITGYKDHPNSFGRGQIYEHVLVMSHKIGRALLPGENVHHINGVRDDNRPENLELWSTKQPPGQRVEDKVAWAIEILSLYNPDALSIEPERMSIVRGV